MTTVNANRFRIVQEFIEAYNRFDVAGMLRTLHPDIEFRNVTDGRLTSHTRGINEFEAQAESARKLFSSRRQLIHSIAFADDRIDVEIDFKATLAVDFPNGFKAGERYELSGRSIFRFSGETIISIEDIS